MRIAVIGAGMAGSAAALALARRGAAVTLFDRFAFGHALGASHGATRLFRTAYFEKPDYVPLLQRSLGLWRSLEEAAGERLFHQTGLLEAGPPDGFLMRGLNRAIAAHGLPVRRPGAGELARSFPQLSVPADFEAIFEQEAGFILADKTLAAQIRLARAAGAMLRPSTRINAWARTRAGVALRTDDGDETFDRAVIAAGPWANDLLNLPTAAVTPVPKTLFWRRAASDAFDLDRGFAPFGIETDDAKFFYGFPAIDEHGVKIAEHTGGAGVARAEDRGDEPAPGEAASLERFLSATIPALAGRPGKFERCLYEMSADGDFLIDRHPDCDRVVFAAGLSGHGFKFAPVLGEALAAMSLDDQAPAGWEFLSLARFA